MYVIIDTHHEKWLDLGLQTPYSTLEIKINSIWRQIATYFKDYDGHLIFEVLNEPRDIDGAEEWTGTTELNNLVYNLNNSLITTIRKISGNEKRIILLTTYAGKSNIEHMKKISELDDKYTMISLHSYSPYTFTNSNTEEFDNSVASDFYNETIKPLIEFKNFSSMPVVLTEFGVYNKENYTDWQKYIELYIKETKKINVPILFWDTGKSETNGLFDRTNYTWYNDQKRIDIFDTYRSEIKNEEYVNKLSDINITSTYKTSGFNSSSSEHVNYGINQLQGQNHYFVIADDQYINSSSSSFKFDSTYPVDSKDGYFCFNLKFKTNSSKIYYYVRLYFYDENDTLLYSDDTYSNRIIYTDNNTNFEEQVHRSLYYVPGAKKVKFDCFSNSSSKQGDGPFDIEIYDITLTYGTIK